MIVPVYKKDLRSNPANYRPIYLTILDPEPGLQSYGALCIKTNSSSGTPPQHSFRAEFSAVYDCATTLNW